MYFLTLGASLHLALFPLFHQTDRPAEFSTPLRFVSEALRLAGGFMPGFFKWWIDAYATNPGTFTIGAILVAFFIWLGVSLGGSINDRMRIYWRSTANALPAPPRGGIYWVRTSWLYQWILWASKRHVLPALSAAAIVYVAVTLVSHIVFNVEDAAGYYCKEGVNPKPVPINEEVSSTVNFKAADMCWASGISVQQGRRYLITVTKVSDTWKDREFTTDIGGFEISELPNVWDRAKMLLFVPLRRVFLRPWFRLIGRVGAVGTDEYFMDPDRQEAGQEPLTKYSVTVRPRRDGEFFMYVNDAVSAIPAFGRHLYANNTGEAAVSIKHLPR